MRNIYVRSLRYIYYPLPTIRGPTQSIPLTQQREGFDHDGFLLILVRYTCIARMRFGNQIMNKYHIIMHDVDVCLILIVHLIQNQLVLKKIYFKIHGIVHCKA